MVWPDIDVNVQLPHEQDVATFFELGRAIATSWTAIKMSFSNQFVRPDVPFDHGLYWGTRLLVAGREWKLDLWGYGEEAFLEHQQAFAGLQRRLDSVDRLAILRIKHDICRRPSYRVTLASMDIYAAVADHQVRSVEQFDAWLCSRERAET